MRRAVARLSSLGIDGTFLFLTKTGFEKSIMDATASVRDYFSSKGIHDYALQRQGPQHKVRLQSYFFLANESVNSYASLYRPNAKMGDPRIWFDGLARYARAGDVLCIVAHRGNLLVLNASDDLLWASAQIPDSPLSEAIREINEAENKTSSRLLELIKGRVSQPLRTVRSGSTGVGATLENALGIQTNSSRAPDWNGIELKAGRRKKSGGVRSTLFAQVPTWELSNLKSSKELVFKYGYPREGFQKLNCQVSAISVNSQGLFLALDEKTGLLHERFSGGERTDPKALSGSVDVVAWEMSLLKRRLEEKHKETFWVSARSTGSGADEVFEYYEIEHTKSPMVNAFATLLDTGVVTLDHLIKSAPDGTTKERGPLFKIDRRNFGLLFPPSQIYRL